MTWRENVPSVDDVGSRCSYLVSLYHIYSSSSLLYTHFTIIFCLWSWDNYW